MHAASRIGLLALAVLVAAPVIAFGSTPATGLRGTVRKGPIRPVCREGEPCDAPARATLVFTRTDGVTVRTRTGALGGYRITLAAGYYSVATKERIGISRTAIRPRRVHIRAGHVDRIDFFIDTGVR